MDSPHLFAREWVFVKALIHSTCSEMSFIIFTDYSNWKVLSLYVMFVPLVVLFVAGLLLLV